MHGWYYIDKEVLVTQWPPRHKPEGKGRGVCCDSCPPFTSHLSLFLAEFVLFHSWCTAKDTRLSCPFTLLWQEVKRNSFPPRCTASNPALENRQSAHHTLTSWAMNEWITPGPCCLLHPTMALYCLPSSTNSSFKSTFSLCPVCSSQRSVKTQTMVLKVWADARRQSLALEVMPTWLILLSQTFSSCVASEDIGLSASMVPNTRNEDDLHNFPTTLRWYNTQGFI